jgi:hypothetical protein
MKQSLLRPLQYYYKEETMAKRHEDNGLLMYTFTEDDIKQILANHIEAKERKNFEITFDIEMEKNGKFEIHATCD